MALGDPEDQREGGTADEAHRCILGNKADDQFQYTRAANGDTPGAAPRWHQWGTMLLPKSVRFRVRHGHASGLAPFPDGEPPQRMPVGSSDAASRAALSTSVEFENLVYLRSQGAWYAIRDGETL